MVERKPLRSFRLEDELWEQFKDWCHNNKTDASKALKSYIESVLTETGNDQGKGDIRLEINDVLNNQTVEDIVRLEVHTIKQELEEKIALTILSENTHLLERLEALEKKLSLTR